VPVRVKEAAIGVAASPARASPAEARPRDRMEKVTTVIRWEYGLTVCLGPQGATSFQLHRWGYRFCFPWGLGAATIPTKAPGNTVAFSAKTEYGLVSLLELAAIHPQGGVLQVAEIAARQGIPDRYLEQMLTSLRRGQILRSIRGPRGGYQLSRPPAEIRIAEVVVCLEGEVASRGTAARQSAEFEVIGGLEGRLGQARQAILEGTSLQDLLDERDQRLQSQVMYFI
jgi:Rrf2 family protein